MAIDGVGGKQHTGIEKRDMESLGTQENSKEASIFNKIDESDGVRDGELSDLQYSLYKYRTEVANLRGQRQKIKVEKINKQAEQRDNETIKGPNFGLS